MLLTSVSDVALTVVPDVTNMALPYCAWGLSMTKSIPGTLGRMSFGPRWVSCMQTTAHWCLLLRSVTSCCFAAGSSSTLKDKIVKAGPEKDPSVWLWLVSRFLGIIFLDLCEGGSRIADIGIWQGPRCARFYCRPRLQWYDANRRRNTALYSSYQAYPSHSEPGKCYYCQVFLIEMHSHRLLEIVELCWHRKNFGQLFLLAN